MDLLSKAWSGSAMVFVSGVALSKIQYHKEITWILFTLIECEGEENFFNVCNFKARSRQA